MKIYEQLANVQHELKCNKSIENIEKELEEINKIVNDDN